MGRGKEPGLGGPEAHLLEALFPFQVKPRGPATLLAMDRGQIFARAEFFVRFAQQDDEVARVLKPLGDTLRDRVQNPDHGNGRRRRNRLPIGFIIEADVAADYRNLQGLAGGPHPVNGLDKLPHHLRLLGITKIEAVGQGHRPGPADGQVARALGDRNRRSPLRVEGAVAAITIDTDAQPLVRLFQPNDGRIRAGLDHRIPANQKIVLPVDPFLTGKIRRGEQGGQNGGIVGRQRQGAEVQLLFRRQVGRSGRRAFVGRGLRGQGRDRNANDLLSPPRRAEQTIVRDLPNDDRLEVPDGKHVLDGLFTALLGDDQHPLLGFGQQQLIGSNTGFAGRDGVQVQDDTGLAPVGHFHRRAGQAGGPHVLNPDNQVLLHEAEAGLDQDILGERVAHLDGRPELFGLVVEFPRGQQARAVNAVPAGARAHIDDRIAHARGRRPKNPVGRGNAQGKGIDQDIAVIAGVEIHLAADGRYTDTIPVAANTAHHAPEQMGGARMPNRPEAERVQRGNRTGAHGKDIAQDTADPGGGSVIGLDKRRMVMAFDLKDRGQPVTDIDDTGILARPLQDGRSGRGQTPQKAPGTLIATVLRPHHREHAQLLERRGAPQGPDDAVVLVG